MSRPPADSAAALFVQAQFALNTTQEEVGRVMGVSRRTMSRWMRERTPTIFRVHAERLARAVHPEDPQLAAQIAEAGGLTLAGLGLKPPGADLDAAMGRTRADAVVCDAAEVLDASPRAVRPALLAAVRRARREGLSLEALETYLTPVNVEAPSKEVTPRRRGRGKMGAVVDE